MLASGDARDSFTFTGLLIDSFHTYFKRVIVRGLEGLSCRRCTEFFHVYWPV